MPSPPSGLWSRLLRVTTHPFAFTLSNSLQTASGYWRLPSLPWPAKHRELSLLGLFRVGTNITRTLLESHYKVLVRYNQLGWKHGPVPTYAPGAPGRYRGSAPLVIVKHPLSTVHSWHGYLHKVRRNMRSEDDQTLPSFLRARLTCFCEELPQHPEYRFGNPLHMWNFLVWNQVRYAEDSGGLVVRYEDMLANPQAECDRIARHYRLEQRHRVGPVRAIQKVARRMGDKRRSTLLPLDRSLTDQCFEKTAFFLEGRFLDEFNAEDLAFADRELDPVLMERLGYCLKRQHPVQERT